MIRIQRVEGRSMDDALRRAAEVCGSDAVVIAQESVAGGGVTLSVSRPMKKAKSKLAGRAGSLRPEPRREAVPASVGSALSVDAAESADVGEVRERLGEAGCSAEFIERVLTPVKRLAAEGMHAIDASAEVLGRLFRVAPSPKLKGSLQVLAVVGPTGAGKTTSLAKLAVLLQAAGRRIAFATMDTYRVGAVDQLRAYAEILQVPLFVAHDGDQLAGAVEAARDLDVLLVDTAGRSPSDTENLTRLARDFERAGRAAELDCYLVLSAAAGKGALETTRQAYAVLDPRAAIVTKTDETRENGVALEFCLRNGIEAAFLCDGQDVHEHIHRAAPGAFADLLLRGRIA